jgi:hypothetical protein
MLCSCCLHADVRCCLLAYLYLDTLKVGARLYLVDYIELVWFYIMINDENILCAQFYKVSSQKTVFGESSDYI